MITLNARLPTPPPPPEGIQVIEAVRNSCEEVRRRYNVQLNEADCDQFLRSIDPVNYQRLCNDRANGRRFPLQFSSPLDELNVVCMLGLLNCLHAHRDFLREKTGRGAWEVASIFDIHFVGDFKVKPTVRYLVLGAYLGSSSILTTAGMLQATTSSLASLISLPLHVERPMEPGSPITVGEPDKHAVELVEQLVQLLHSTAQVLQRESCPDLGSFVASHGLSGGDGDKLLRLLLKAFEGFRDMYILDGQPVYILKKALFLVESISATFRDQTGSKTIPIPKISSPLPILADNVVPTMLLHFKLLNLKDSPDPEISAIDLESPSSLKLSPRAATILRASSVACCQQLIQRARAMAVDHEWLGSMTEDSLDSYLWAIAKDDAQLRKLERVTELGTVMY
ncbi:uncharacterized protein MELLADRAFT_116678 [Melampsora larici-populina 98AG31]|uniref:Queuosine 5'-phosphate N-glycosylase/hydrolase n=1 Tax=Melampsora larici-populina (strain 98AG31 / pathotype 3-4-7) TaxID=747676 RepID=F4RP18_MELLP|nr:uncharacterized protein MELLADRAFT_116678 [Melampsora larici-populina 98AG31]EGG05931.1 hypothetical protein MELLADRAFT_116678 [Melampsora larici-populina 98AG31]